MSARKKPARICPGCAGPENGYSCGYCEGEYSALGWLKADWQQALKIARREIAAGTRAPGIRP